MVLDELKGHQRFVIFGSQVVAYSAYTAIKSLTGRTPEAFIVSGEGDNRWAGDDKPREVIDGIPVMPAISTDRDIFVVVGVTELIQKEVLPWLKEKGFMNVFPLTQHEEHVLMSEYYKREGLNVSGVSGKEHPSGQDTGTGDVSLAIYEVKNHRDKQLFNHPALFPFERSIQAGAALTDERIAPFTDDEGDNISIKNHMYCEMSAVYWIWKNEKHDWVGIEHYRRHLLVRPEMIKPGIDAFLPLPYLCYPNEASQFRRFINEKVFNSFLRALSELHPENIESYRAIIYGKYQYTYNLICARWDVFDEYCSWFFNITEYMEKTMGEEVPDLKETRAFSYIAEVLTNIFFLSNRDRFNIMHVEKEIYT